MTAVIFGAKGQDGRYLTDLLNEGAIKVVGIDRTTPEIDICDLNSIVRLISKIKPEYIFHLAAKSSTKYDYWKENHDVISTGTLNILAACLEHSPNSKIFISGSGLQFKNQGKPINESAEFDPSSMYAVSRIHSVYAARFYRKLGLSVYVGYFFNHDSPLRSNKHINQRVVEAARRIAAGSNEKLSIGDLKTRKEFGFAGDVVKGIWTLINQDQIYEAVIGTGIAYSIEEWVDLCFSFYGLDWRKYVEHNQAFIPEYEILVSDPAKINSMGWKPEIGFHDLAKLMSGM